MNHTALTHLILSIVLDFPLLSVREIRDEVHRAGLTVSDSYLRGLLVGWCYDGLLARQDWQIDGRAVHLYSVPYSRSSDVQAILATPLPIRTHIVAVLDSAHRDHATVQRHHVLRGDPEIAIAAYHWFTRNLSEEPKLVEYVSPSRAGLTRHSGAITMRVINVDALLDWWALPF